ncbi:hypothetical protein WJX73_005215 [Symbiochloris irregularis]|uniref:Uncharacterized protein n=1 Tax=Symbiochloris irregularis TaxID=706552 RepID=A0AAW1P1G3_9CHLO
MRWKETHLSSAAPPFFPSSEVFLQTRINVWKPSTVTGLDSVISSGPPPSHPHTTGSTSAANASRATDAQRAGWAVWCGLATAAFVFPSDMFSCPNAAVEGRPALMRAAAEDASVADPYAGMPRWEDLEDWPLEEDSAARCKRKRPLGRLSALLQRSLAAEEHINKGSWADVSPEAGVESSSGNSSPPAPSQAPLLGEEATECTPSGADEDGPAPAAATSLGRGSLALAVPCNEDFGPSESEAKRAKFKQFERCSEVGPGLFLSGELVPADRDALRAAGITHVINCIGHIFHNPFPEELTYLTLCLNDAIGEDLASLFYLVFDFIRNAHQQGGRVLLHCSQGVSRSAALAVAHHMWRTGMPYDEATSAIKAQRGVVNPNIGFMCQLLNWETVRTQGHDKVQLYSVVPHSKIHAALLVLRPLNKQSQTALLDPRGVFVLRTPSRFFIWEGREAAPSLLVGAWHGILRLQVYEGAAPDVQGALDGKEPHDFEQALQACGQGMPRYGRCPWLGAHTAHHAGSTLLNAPRAAPLASTRAERPTGELDRSPSRSTESPSLLPTAMAPTEAAAGDPSVAGPSQAAESWSSSSLGSLDSSHAWDSDGDKDSSPPHGDGTAVSRVPPLAVPPLRLGAVGPAKAEHHQPANNPFLNRGHPSREPQPVTAAAAPADSSVVNAEGSQGSLSSLGSSQSSLACDSDDAGCSASNKGGRAVPLKRPMNVPLLNLGCPSKDTALAVAGPVRVAPAKPLNVRTTGSDVQLIMQKGLPAF